MIEEARRLIRKEQELLTMLETKLKKSLSNVRRDTLKISHSHGKIQYSVRSEGEKGNGRYLKKKEQHIAQRIAQRDYDRALERKVTDRINRLKEIDGMCQMEHLSKVYDKLPPARKVLVEPRILTDADYAKKWEEVEYKGKAIDENSPGFYTEKGHAVRSKSEKIIADKLYKMGIPYRYEQPLVLKGFGTIYPDFKVLNIRKRKEIYWEHFGRMDDPEYCEKAIKKINTYIRNGLYPGEQLIMTFETRDCPLDVKVLENIIQNYLL